MAKRVKPNAGVKNDGSNGDGSVAKRLLAAWLPVTARHGAGRGAAHRLRLRKRR